MMYEINTEDIDKWTNQLESALEKIDIFDEKAVEIHSNMKAYIEDSKFFKEKGDVVRSFEAIVFASAIFDTCMQLGVFVQKVDSKNNE